MSKAPITSERKVIIALIALLLGWLLATFIPNNWSWDQQWNVDWSLNSIKQFINEKDAPVVLLDGTGEKRLFSPDSESLSVIKPDSENDVNINESITSSRDSFVVYAEDQNAPNLQTVVSEKPAFLVDSKSVLEQTPSPITSTDFQTSTDSQKVKASSDLIAIQNLEDQFSDQSSNLKTAQGLESFDSMRNAEIKKIEEPQDWQGELKITDYLPPEFDVIPPPAWSDKVGNVMTAKVIENRPVIDQSSADSLFKSNKPQKIAEYVRVSPMDNNGDSDSVSVEKTKFSELKSENAQSAKLTDASTHASSNELSADPETSVPQQNNISIDSLNNDSAILNANHFEALNNSSESSTNPSEINSLPSNESTLQKGERNIVFIPYKKTSFTETQSVEKLQVTDSSEKIVSTDNKTVQAFLLKPQNQSDSVSVEENNDNIKEMPNGVDKKNEQNVLTISKATYIPKIPDLKLGQIVVLDKESSPDDLSQRYSFSDEQNKRFLIFNQDKLKNGVFPVSTQLLIP